MGNLRQKTVWSGTHRGITFEIQNFKTGGTPSFPEKYCWTFYLFLNMKQIPDNMRDAFWLAPKSDDKGRISYDYYESIISDLDWHCGITWYSKISGLDGDTEIVKIGCDYQHYWDEGRNYDVEYVRREAVQCIESLFSKVPDMKVWCRGCGAYYKPDDGCTCKYYKKEEK